MSKIELYNQDCLNILPHFHSKFSAIIADPPYGKLNKKCVWDNVIPLKKMWECLLPLCNETTPIILFSQEPYTSELILSQPELFKYKWYWNKTIGTGFLNAKRQPLRSIEEICVFYKKQPSYNPQMQKGNPCHTKGKQAGKELLSGTYGGTKHVDTLGDLKYPTTLITYPKKHPSCVQHPTEKPLGIMEYLVKTYTNEGDTVLDFCMGSGTTGEACKKLNRDFTGIEKEKIYFEVAKKRLLKEEQ